MISIIPMKLKDIEENVKYNDNKITLKNFKETGLNQYYWYESEAEVIFNKKYEYPIYKHDLDKLTKEEENIDKCLINMFIKKEDIMSNNLKKLFPNYNYKLIPEIKSKYGNFLVHFNNSNFGNFKSINETDINKFNKNLFIKENNINYNYLINDDPGYFRIIAWYNSDPLIDSKMLINKLNNDIDFKNWFLVQIKSIISYIKSKIYEDIIIFPFLHFPNSEVYRTLHIHFIVSKNTSKFFNFIYDLANMFRFYYIFDILENPYYNKIRTNLKIYERKSILNRVENKNCYDLKYKFKGGGNSISKWINDYNKKEIIEGFYLKNINYKFKKVYDRNLNRNKLNKYFDILNSNDEKDFLENINKLNIREFIIDKSPDYCNSLLTCTIYKNLVTTYHLKNYNVGILVSNEQKSVLNEINKNNTEIIRISGKIKLNQFKLKNFKNKKNYICYL